MKAALYLRVSTHEQSTASQRSALEQFASAHGWTIDEVYEDQVSGAKSSRPALDKLLEDARARRFDCVCVYKLDRFGRSLRDCLNHLRTLELHRVRFVGVTQGIDTDRADPAGRFLLHILAAAAEFERELIRERVMSGMQAARRRGKQLGRPKAVFRRDQALKMRAEGASVRTIAGQYGTRAALAGSTRAPSCSEEAIPKRRNLHRHH